MPLGSSSAAPVMSPGPRRRASPCRLSSTGGSGSGRSGLTVALFAPRARAGFVILPAALAPPAFFIAAAPSAPMGGAAAGFCLVGGRMEKAVHRLDDDGAFAHARGDALDRARAD